MTACDVVKVSIVIPVYNQGRYLDHAIQSVLTQRYPNIELIVLDDGSDDGTREILEKYGEKFRWESHANMGQAATLNKGWSMAQGQIIGYLAADDFLHSDAVARSVSVLQAVPEVVLSYVDFEYVDAQGKSLAPVRTPEFNYSDMLLKGICPPGPGAFFRKKHFDQLGGWNGALRRMPDFEFWLRLGLLGSFMRIPEIHASYRMHDDSQSFSPVDSERADEIIRIVDSVYCGCELPVSLRYRNSEARANALLYAARLHLYSGRVNAGLARVAAAIKAYPKILIRSFAWRLFVSGLLRRFGQKFLWSIKRRP